MAADSDYKQKRKAFLAAQVEATSKAGQGAGAAAVVPGKPAAGATPALQPAFAVDKRPGMAARFANTPAFSAGAAKPTVLANPAFNVNRPTTTTLPNGLQLPNMAIAGGPGGKPTAAAVQKNRPADYRGRPLGGAVLQQTQSGYVWRDPTTGQTTNVGFNPLQVFQPNINPMKNWEQRYTQQGAMSRQSASQTHPEPLALTTPPLPPEQQSSGGGGGGWYGGGGGGGGGRRGGGGGYTPTGKKYNDYVNRLGLITWNIR